ncbi:glycosyltransferase family protein [Shimia biformata]|uniref:glycosyltransferase family protein n=1 Tax=Shimia biformata TaxID=1294299 RepID=UPI00195051FA|nr:glycosyltransferase [Shimia biformata]
MRVTIAVTHLLGAGHLSRALTLGRAFAGAGHQVQVLSGGRPARHLSADGLTLVQLPPIASDGTNFTRLLDVDGQVAGPAVFARRQTAAINAMSEFQPQVLITELFPFGRRSLSSEFVALIEAARGLPSPPVVLSSVRDILAPPSKPAKVEKAEALLQEYYDAVLVHSDAAVVALDASWPVSDRVAEMLRYTGFVAPPLPAAAQQGDGIGEILVSAGGGSVGDHIFAAALKAACGDGRRWRLLVGGADASSRISAWRTDAPKNLILEPVRPDFRELIQRATCSVSMCGYNTAMDLLQSGVPSVIVPFDDGGEVEQSLRATALGVLPGIEVVAAADLGAETLLGAIDLATGSPDRSVTTIGFDGAAETVRVVQDIVAGKERR